MAENMAHVIKKIALALFYILIYFSLSYLLGRELEYLEEDIENYSGVLSIVASVAALCIYFIILYVRELDIKRYIKTKRLNLIELMLSFVMAVGFRLLTCAYFVWSEMNVPILQRSIESVQQGYDFNTMTGIGEITVILSMCIIAPVFEEILFRGLVQKELSDAMPVFLAIVLQGLAFGLAHSVLAQSLFAVIFGIILGAIYHRTKNILVVICCHMFFNISSAWEIKSVEMMKHMVLTGLVLTLASIIIFFYIYRRRTPAQAGELKGGNIND